MSIKVVELFAGVGGFRVGLEQSSKIFETIWANQWEPGKKTQHAYNCYISHFGDHSCVNEDINKVKNDVPFHDLLVGGFPCQDYSVAATGAKGIEGKKGVLWWDIRDIIEEKKPTYILLENVDRLIKSPASQRGRDFGIILKSLNDLGYMVQWRIINAADYGAAQRRRRVFIFAVSKSTNYFKEICKLSQEEILLKEGFFAKAFKVKSKVENRETPFNLNLYKDLVEVTKNFQCNFWNSGICFDGKGLTLDILPKVSSPISLKNIIENEIVDDSFYLNDYQIEQFKKLRNAKKLLRHRPNGEEYYYSEGAMSPYDSLDLPARTMLTSEGSINRSTHIIKDDLNGKLRLLTQLECERINGFPDNWTNSGMPQKFRYFCMGNALVVPLITKMGKELVEIHKNEKD